MAHSITIENEYLRMEVWPQLGGKVSSIVDRADGFELLFNYPEILPEGYQYDIPYAHGWYAGWDECFPAVGPSKYVGHPYDGIPVPDHGELWGLPTMAIPMRDGITTIWHGLRFGYRLTRKLYLEGPVLTAEYSLQNLAPFDFRFVWAQHALLAMAVPIKLEVEAGTAFRLSHNAEGTDLQEPFQWPLAHGKDDLSLPCELPARSAWKVFSENPIARPLTVRYPSRGRALRIEYTCDDDLKAYWGLWVNTGGRHSQRYLSVEPTTGRFDQIDRSICDGSAATVGPLGSCGWSVNWTVG